MAMLTSKSSRFARSMNYTMPEYRPNSARGTSHRISVVAPNGAGSNRESKARSERTRES